MLKDRNARAATRAAGTEDSSSDVSEDGYLEVAIAAETVDSSSHVSVDGYLRPRLSYPSRLAALVMVLAEPI